MSKVKVMTVFGTRPEAIKMAPIVKGLKERDTEFDTITVVTAQHRQMLDQVLRIFDIVPDYDLDIMKQQQTLDTITSSVITGLSEIMESEKPDIVLVHGDTTTTFAASVSAFYHRINIGHVEAGLRTWEKYNPYPEEMNRQMTDVLSDIYFAPTSKSKDNLLLENHDAAKVFVTGNTAIDALKSTVSANYHHDVLEMIDPNKKLVLVTMHRRENQGEPMRQVFSAIRDVVQSRQDVEVIYPVHLNPVVQKLAHKILGVSSSIHLIDPLDVVDFHNIASKSYFIMTDSGGVQEEAPSLGKPVLVLRDTTERPEGVTAGTLKLVGTSQDSVKEAMTTLLDDGDEYKRMAEAPNPYGDGSATKRILDGILFFLGKTNKAPQEFR